MPSLSDEQIAQLKSEGYSLNEILEADGYSPEEVGSIASPALSSGPVNLNPDAPVDLNIPPPGYGLPFEQRADLPVDVAGSEWQQGVSQGVAQEETNQLMKEGYNQGAGFMNKAIPTVAGAFTGTPLVGAVLGEVGENVGDILSTGQIQKTPEQMIGDTAINYGIGKAVPAITSGLGKALEWTGDLFNKPAGVARRLGAAKVELNPEAEKFVVQKVEDLMNNSDFFNKHILTSSDPGKQWDRAKGYKDIIGRQIGDFYATNEAIPVLRDEIFSAPQITKLQGILQNPNAPLEIKNQAQSALSILEQVIPQGRDVMALSDVWEMRKFIDDSLIKNLYNRGASEVPLNVEYVSDVANALRSSMDNSINVAVQSGKLAPEVAQRLLRNKQEFSNISTVTKMLGNKLGQTSGKDIFDKVTAWSPLTRPLAPLAPGIGAVRAGAARLGNAGQTLFGLAPSLSPYAIAGSALFPRSTDPKEINQEELKEAVFFEAMKVMPPQGAQMMVQQIDQTMTSGNSLAKKQLMAELTFSFPDLFEPPQEGVATIDNEYLNPMDKDAIVRSSLDAPPAERASRIGKSFENKYVPPSNPQPQQTQAPLPSANVDIDMMMNSLNGSFEMDNSYNSEASEMTNEMELNKLVHAQDY